MKPEIQKKLGKPQRMVICGAGLGGTVLALDLCRAGYEVTLLEGNTHPPASQVAAGLYNLITGKFNVLTWEAEALLAAMRHFFQQPEFSALAAYLHDVPVYRPFPGVAELNEWSAKANEAPYNRIVTLADKPVSPDLWEDAWGGYKVMQAGWLDIPAFLSAAHALLESRWGVRIRKARPEPGTLRPGAMRMQAGTEEIAYDKLIFAEGTHMLHNPLFNWIPLIPLKGQVLRGEIRDLEMPFIYSGGAFLLQTGPGAFVAGSTYERTFSHPDPDEEGKEEILSKLPRMIRERFIVHDHRAGIRPATRDRRPIAGPHPLHPEFFLFNGLGAKGVLHSFWLAKQSIQFFRGESDTIPREASVMRFVKRFFVT